MTSMTMAFDGVRELSVEEIDAVAGAAAPVVYYGVRAAAGAILVGGYEAVRQAQGDGLSWEDWDEIAVAAGYGALGGLVGGGIGKHFPAK